MHIKNNGRFIYGYKFILSLTNVIKMKIIIINSIRNKIFILEIKVILIFTSYRFDQRHFMNNKIWNNKSIKIFTELWFRRGKWWICWLRWRKWLLTSSNKTKANNNQHFYCASCLDSKESYYSFFYYSKLVFIMIEWTYIFFCVILSSFLRNFVSLFWLTDFFCKIIKMF